MRHAILAALLLIWPVNLAAQDQTKSDVTATIQSQLDAFLADDFATAFQFASPNIQMMFRNSDNFGMMVRQGYPMVWRPAQVDYLELRQEAGRPVQRVMIRDADGRIHMLDYYMMPGEKGWVINGVSIVEANVPVT